MNEQEGSFSVGLLHPGGALSCRHISELQGLVKVARLQQLPRLLLQGDRLQHPHLPQSVAQSSAFSAPSHDRPQEGHLSFAQLRLAP